jgi:hypothetical protein
VRDDMLWLDMRCLEDTDEQAFSRQLDELEKRVPKITTP